MGTIGCRGRNSYFTLETVSVSVLGLVQVLLWDKCSVQCTCQRLFARPTVLLLLRSQ